MTTPAHPDRQGTREALTDALRVGEPWPGAPRPEVIAERIADVLWTVRIGILAALAGVPLYLIAVTR